MPTTHRKRWASTTLDRWNLSAGRSNRLVSVTRGLVYVADAESGGVSKTCQRACHGRAERSLDLGVPPARHRTLRLPADGADQSKPPGTRRSSSGFDTPARPPSNCRRGTKLMTDLSLRRPPNASYEPQSYSPFERHEKRSACIEHQGHVRDVVVPAWEVHAGSRRARVD